MKKIGLLFIAFLTLATVAMAQVTDSVTTNFIYNASLANMKEIRAGQLAISKAQNPGVKVYGGRMVSDHTQANTLLQALVAKKGYKVSLPSENDAVPDAMLTGTSGSAFDRNYITMMIDDHKKVIAMFQTASLSTDPDIRSFAKKMLPTLKQHLKTAESLAVNLNIQASK